MELKRCVEVDKQNETNEKFWVCWGASVGNMLAQSVMCVYVCASVWIIHQCDGDEGEFGQTY